MLPLLQLLVAVFAIYSVIEFQEEVGLYVALGCLVLMLVISRIDKKKSENKTARKDFLKSEIDKFTKNESPINELDFLLLSLYSGLRMNCC